MIRASISCILDVDGAALDQNLVYAHPTINSLGSYVARVANRDTLVKQTTDARDVIAEMLTYVEKFSENFPVHTGSKTAEHGEVILLTGTTGSFGSLILGELLQISSVKRVYAFNRSSNGGKKPLKDRQRKTFLEQGLDPHLVESEKLILLEGDTSKKWFGVDKELHKVILESVTSIIHNGDLSTSCENTMY